jgi:rhodanese-related sulfurtransferase
MSNASIDRFLAHARSRIGRRVAASELADELNRGALVIDTRSAAQRERDGELPGAVVVERNVLEWRLDPSSPHHLSEVNGPDQRMVIVCDEGYASSRAAAALAEIGLTNVTDLDGGFQAWRAVD